LISLRRDQTASLVSDLAMYYCWSPKCTAECTKSRIKIKKNVLLLGS